MNQWVLKLHSFFRSFGISLTEEQEAKIAQVRAGTQGSHVGQNPEPKPVAPTEKDVPMKAESVPAGQRGKRSRSPRKIPEPDADKVDL